MLVHFVIPFTIKLYARINIFNHKIIVKCNWKSGCAVSLWADSWESPGGDSGGKALENFTFLHPKGKLIVWNRENLVS